MEESPKSAAAIRCDRIVGHKRADFDQGAVEVLQDGRIHIEKINAPMLYQLKATPEEYKAGLDRAISKGWLELHESGTFVRFTQAGADLFA